MTSQNPDGGYSTAARLREALAAPDQLRCAEVRAMLPDLVAAEQAGLDVDADPIFAALLRHLDSCDDCLGLYEELSEAVAALDPDREQPVVPPATRVPTFFPQPPTQRLQLFAGQHRFVLTVPLPRPLVGTLGGANQSTLFDGLLAEAPGQPTLSVHVQDGERGATVRISVRVAGDKGPWRVALQAGNFAASGATDERGSTLFTNVPLDGLDALEIDCSPLDTSEK